MLDTDSDFEYDDFLDFMEGEEISYRDEYRNQTAFLNEDFDDEYDDDRDEDSFED